MGAPTHVESKSNEYAPILVRTQSTMTAASNSQTLPRFYGGFEHQKHRWATINRRSQRIRNISYLQIVLGLLAAWNYLWLSNIFACFVGLTGLMACRSEKLSWTLVYLLVCMMEFVRIVLLAPHLYARYCIPHYQFTGYECFQVGVLVVEQVVLMPGAFFVVFAAAAKVANPLW